MKQHWNRTLAVHVVAAALLGAMTPLAAADLPEADAVLEDSVEAVGGREALENIETLHVTSTMTMMGQEITMETAWSGDDGRFVKTTMPMGEQVMGTNGETAWMKSPMGYSLLPEEQARQMELQTTMYIFMLDPKTYGKNDLKSIETVGEEEFAGTQCYKLHYVSQDDKEGHVYYAVDSGLPVGFMQRQGGENGDKSTLLFKDWKEVEGVTFFHLIEMKMEPGKNSNMPSGGAMEGEIKVSELAVNSLDGEFFALPEEVKELAANKPADGEPADEIKLEDLTPEEQKEAKQLLENYRQMPSTAMLKQVLGAMEPNLQHMPAEKRKMMQYVAQELKKEIASREE